MATPRASWALIAIAEKYDGIAFLDAGNWFDAGHLETCLTAAQSIPEAPYVIARRHFIRPDGSVMGPFPSEDVPKGCARVRPCRSRCPFGGRSGLDDIGCGVIGPLRNAGRDKVGAGLTIGYNVGTGNRGVVSRSNSSMVRRTGEEGVETGPAPLQSRGRRRGPDRLQIGIQSVDIALDILKRIASNRSAISLSSLSRESGIQPSKLHRYLVSFTRNGLLNQSAVTGLYDLGPQAVRLGLAALNRFDEMGQVQQAATTFCARTGHTVSICVWTDQGPTLVRLEPGSHPQPVLLKVGSALPLCTSATGRVFLAFMAKTLTKPLVDDEMRSAAKDGVILPDRDWLERELGQIRADGIHVTAKAIIPGIAVVAPVFDPRGEIVCTMAALAPRGHGTGTHRSRLVADVRATVNILTRNMFGEGRSSGDKGLANGALVPAARETPGVVRAARKAITRR